jgi:CDP-diacylglycerol---glycerol-3-phosphate 3-phosphatidyltransferase
LAYQIYTIPNIITITRIVLIPVLVIIFYMSHQWSNILAALLFAVAGATDWVDGYLARKLNQSTKLGAFLDPVADKLLVVTAIVLLVEAHANPWLALPAIVIVGREVAVSALREWMAEIGERANVAVSKIGKIKTTVQIIAIAILLAKEVNSVVNFADFFVLIGYLLFYVATVLTLWSMILYLKAAWPFLMSADDIEN